MIDVDDMRDVCEKCTVFLLLAVHQARTLFADTIFMPIIETLLR